MSALTQVQERRLVLAWTVTIAAAFAVYFSGLSHEAIWYDESISAAIAGRSAAGILRFMPGENHPPLHFLLLHFATLLFGDSEWVLRLPSALLLATRRSFWHITDSLGVDRDIADILAETPGWQLASEPRRFSGAPFSLIDFIVARYERVEQPRMRAGYGSLKLHISGLKRTGNLLVLLNDRFPFEPNRLSFRAQVVPVADEQMDTTVSVVPHGDYVLLLIADESGNFDSDPGEAIWIYNEDQAKQKGFVFDILKFSFHELERSFEIRMRG